MYYNLLIVSTKKKKNAANALTPINFILFRITKNVIWVHASQSASVI